MVRAGDGEPKYDSQVSSWATEDIVILVTERKSAEEEVA